ncbi:hypothetical protein D3C77_204760 [compost metagenome]
MNLDLLYFRQLTLCAIGHLAITLQLIAAVLMPLAIAGKPSPTDSPGAGLDKVAAIGQKLSIVEHSNRPKPVSLDRQKTPQAVKKRGHSLEDCVAK